MTKLNPQNQTHLQYRADIDGLRAIAVVLVVLYHAFPQEVRGGYIGVDIFFIISGYLISSIIYKSLDHQKFSIIDFYRRRVARIFPSLLIVLTACFGIGWLSLFTGELKQLGKHLASAAGFVSNLTLLQETGYFDNASELKPLLHLWSLGIEEQFYIFWPLLLWATWKLKRSRFSLILMGTLVSFIYCLATLPNDQTLAFYSPLSRFWELMLGGILAYTSIYNVPPTKPVGVVKNNILSILGLLLILVASLSYTKSTLFPGWNALLPCLGALLIISAGPQAWINRGLLAKHPVVFIGLISYPLYLWHWPIFSYAHILHTEAPPYLVTSLLVGLSFVAAWLTYEFYEKPLRESKSPFKIPILLSSMLAMAIIGLVTYQNEGFEFRTPNEYHEQPGSYVYLNKWDDIRRNDLNGLDKNSYCYLVGKPQFAIFGDSHGIHLYSTFINASDPQFHNAIFLGAGACPPTLGYENRKNCEPPTRKAVQVIKATDSIQAVIMVANAQYAQQMGPAKLVEYKQAFERTFQELRSAHKNIFFLVDTPTLRETAYHCTPTQLKLRNLFKKERPFCNQEISDSAFQDQSQYRQLVSDLQRDNADVIFFDTTPLFCTNQGCRIYKDGKILFEDTNHLSIFGSQFLADSFLPFLAAKIQRPKNSQ